MHKALKYALKTLVSILALLSIGTLLFIWRVSNGPVELDGYSPFLRNLLIEQGVGDNVRFERSILTWRSAKNNPTGTSSFEVRFLNIDIEDDETSLALRVPEAGMQFSPTAMFRGVIAPTFVEFDGLELNVLLPEEAWSGEAFDQAAFVEAMREYLDEFNNSPDLVPRMTKQILAQPSPLSATGYLQQLTLANTKISITDEISGDVWLIPDALLDIKRVVNGLRLDLEGVIDFEEDNDIPLQMQIVYSIPNEAADTRIRFSNFIPKNIAGEVEGLSSLATLDIPIGGTIDFSIDKEFALPVFEFEIDTSSGMINPADLYNEPIQIDQTMLTGRFRSAIDTVEIDDFYLRFDGASVSAQGRIENIRSESDILLKAELKNLPLTNLAIYWPTDLARGARVWIERNITAGLITDGEIDVNIRPEMWALDEMPPDSFVFDFNVVDGVSHYLKPMPQLTQFKGSATLRLNHFLLKVESGKIENVSVENGVFHFNDIARKGMATAHFELPINGRVEEILKVIDNQPLGYPSQYGIKPDSILGDAQTFLTLDFPLIKDLKIGDVDFNVEADVENLNIPKLSDELSISEGTMALTVNRQGIISNGDIVLNGIELKAEWTEDFTGESEFPTSYIVAGDVEGDGWDRLNLPFAPYVEGPAHAYLSLKAKGSNLVSGEGTFDLKDGQITFEPLGWLKETGTAADVEFGFGFNPDGAINVNDIVFTSDEMNSELQLAYDGELTSRLYIKSLEMKSEEQLAHDFSGLFEWDYDNKLYQVSIKGNQFNAIPIMDIVLAPNVEDAEETELPDFNLAGSVANVSMYNDVEMQEATVLTGYINDEVIDFGFNGKWNGDRNLSILIASLEEIDAPQKLTLQTNDAGHALRSLDFFTSGDQGDLLIEADMVLEDKGYSMSGTITASEFSVANSKAFSELLKAKEFAKAQEELEKNGLSFESFESEFNQYDDVLTFTSGSARGPTLGVTVDGFIDQKYDQISLDGTIIPAYGLNSLLSNIPLLGTILAGGKGEGVFSATYNMAGTVEDPEVNINPLMALAPGIFRKIFGAIGGGNNNTPTVREEAEKLEAEKKEEEQAASIVPPG